MKVPKGKEREPAPIGAHNSVACQVIDLGTQEPNDPKFQAARKVQLAFELVDEKTEEGSPFVVYKSYTFSASSKSNLSKDLKAWLGIKEPEDFDLADVLGKPALINIEHKEKKNGSGIRADISSITPLPKSMKAKKGTEPLKALFLDESFDEDTFNDLPDFMKTMIAASPEYAEIIEARQNRKPKKSSNGKATATSTKKK
jgi:hypothetical protein